MLVDSKKNARPKVPFIQTIASDSGFYWRAQARYGATTGHVRFTIELGGGCRLTCSIDGGRRLQRTDEIRFSRGWLPIFRGSSGEVEKGRGHRPGVATTWVFVPPSEAAGPRFGLNGSCG
jgi:hypothetical protein